MNGPLVALVRPPQLASAQPPLLVLLHGVGSNESDLFGLAEAFDPRFLVLSVRAPLAMGPGAYGWFPVQFTPEGPVADADQAQRSLEILTTYLDQAVVQYRTDPARTVVLGFSQGAILASGLGLAVPERIRGVVMHSGRILPEFVGRAAATERLSSVRWLVVHGTEDRVLPVHHGRASRQTLVDLGLAPEFLEFPMGHSVTDQSLAAVTEWVSRLMD